MDEEIPESAAVLRAESSERWRARENMTQRPIRVLVGKPGLDGHDRGAKVIARALRDAGMEVIYTGLHQTPEAIVNVAIQEDVDVVGLSLLSGAHLTLVPLIIAGLNEQGAGDIVIMVGGIIPEDDVAALKVAGAHAVFGPGTSTETVVEFIQGAVREQVLG